MAPDSHRPLNQPVHIRLLDSAQGRPIQEWRFVNNPIITLGRADQCDVTVADPQVSREHAKLVWKEGQWRLLSLGRNGTLVDDRVIADLDITGTTFFRLGPDGPQFSFGLAEAESSPTETISSIDPDIFAKLQVDELRKAEEVEQIAGDALFKELVDQSRLMKARRRGEAE